MTGNSKDFPPICSTALHYVEVQHLGGKPLLLPVIPGKIEQYRGRCCNDIFLLQKHVEIGTKL